MDALQRFNIGQIGGRIGEIVRDPTSNLMASLLLLAAFAIVILFVLLIAAMFILNASDDDEESDEYEDDEGRSLAAAAAVGAAATGTRVDFDETEPVAEPVPEEPKKPWPIRVGLFLLWTIVVFMLVWVAAGATTAQTSACVSCHTQNPHKRTANTDPHLSTACFRCHESGGVVGAVTYNVPSRVSHFITGILSRGSVGTYGQAVSSDACSRCHGAVLTKTVTVQPQGIRVSHKEPLAAGAECVDCHAMNSGIVSNQTVGMSPCLRCHDGSTVKSDCAVCHTKDPGAAIRPAQSQATARGTGSVSRTAAAATTRRSAMRAMV